MRILLVEDHDPTREVLARLLIHSGHEAVVAETMAGAIATATSQPFDAVITDLGLPDGTGVELMRTLSAAHGLRGIALTGHDSPEDLRETSAAGFVAHLVKPVDMNELHAALRALLHTHHD